MYSAAHHAAKAEGNTPRKTRRIATEARLALLDSMSTHAIYASINVTAFSHVRGVQSLRWALSDGPRDHPKVQELLGNAGMG